MKNNKMQIKKISKKILRIIKNYEHIIIFHHIRPDGDCLGSQQALKLWLSSKFPNKKIYAVGSNENLFPFLKFEFDEIPNEEILSSALGIVVDANYFNRIYKNEIIKNLKNIIRIDHHPENDDVDYLFRFVDSSYCSSAEQISHIIKSIDKTIDKEIAKFLYLGIYTDSGRFFYDYTSSRTHSLTAWLFKSNFNFFELHKNLSIRTIKEIEFNKEVLSQYKTYKNVIYYYLTQDKIKKMNLSETSISRVDFLANIQGYDIWIFFIENKDKTIRARLRSNDKDISQLARKYNGGGHKKASGATLNDEKQIEEIVKEAANL